MSDTDKRSEQFIEVKEASLTEAARTDNDPFYVSPEDSRRVLRKTDLNMMPVLCAIIALQFLDKTALTYTSVMGLQFDTKLKGDQYGWLGSIFSLGLLVGQYPMCFLQQRLPLSKFTAFNIIVWGVAVSCTAVCHNFKQLMACRFVLGVFESSISPALMLFTAQWYRKREQGTRTGIWASFNTWGGILGAGVAYALYKAELKHELSMKAWRCLFLFFGCTTIFLGIVFAIVVPDTPAKAWFLTAEEKVIAVRRTSENMENIGVKKWEWYQVKDAYTDPQVILMCFVALITSIPNGGITNFYGIMVVGIGIDVATGILLSMLNAWVAIVTIIAMVSGEKLRRRTLTCAAPHIISMTGAILVWKLPNSAKKARLAGFYLTLVFNISMVACMSLISSNVVGRTKKTVSAAAFFIFTCVGNLIGPQTFRKKHAPRYEPALITIVICNILAMCAMLLLFMYYRRENRRRDDLAKQNAAATTELSHLAEHETGEADLTDRENLHFRYVL